MTIKLLYGRILSLLVTLVLILTLTVPVSASSGEYVDIILNIDGVNQNYVTPKIKLIVGGTELSNLDLPAINLEGQTLVPASNVLTALGAVATWNAVYKELLVVFHEKMMILQINNEYANIDGELIKMKTTPKLINNKMMISTDILIDVFGITATRDEANRIVYVWDNTQFITSGNTPVPTLNTSTAPPQISQPAETAATNPTNNANGTYPSIVQPMETPTPVPTANDYLSQIYGTENLPESLIAERAVDISSAPIVSASYPSTKIIDLVIPEDNDSTFIVKASSEISKVDKILLPDNRIVLDIINAEFALGQNLFTIEHPNVQQVRVAQNQVNPELITRIVFDVKAASDFSVELSADRKSIMVSFQRNAVFDIKFSSTGVSDTITMTTQNHATLNIFSLNNPQRIVIDTPNSDMRKIINDTVNGKYIKSINSGLFEARTARIELEMSADASYEILDMGTTISIVFSEPTYKNIDYDTKTQTLKFAKASGVFIDINAIALNDEYSELKYTLTLPANFEKAIGYGEYIIKDDWLHSILVKTVEGRTQITLFEKKILAITILEDSQYVYIKLLKPSEKYDKIVVIDPGHGGSDPGTQGTNIDEKDIVLDIVKKTLSLLQIDGSVKAYSTRLTDVYPGLFERVDFTNALEADLFISVHVNSAENDTTANGTEVYWYPHANDAEIGYTGNNVANILQKNLLAKLGTKDRKVKEEAHVVTRYANIPAVLAEIAFLSNPAEEQKLATDYFRMQAADAIYLSIIEIFKEYHPKH